MLVFNVTGFFQLERVLKFEYLGYFMLNGTGFSNLSTMVIDTQWDRVLKLILIGTQFY